MPIHIWKKSKLFLSFLVLASTAIFLSLGIKDGNIAIQSTVVNADDPSPPEPSYDYNNYNGSSGDGCDSGGSDGGSSDGGGCGE